MRPRYIAEADTVALPLFQVNPTPKYRRDKPTSVEAAKKCRDNAAIMRARIVETLKAYPFGLNVSELMELFGIEERNRVAPRCSELSSEEYGSVIRDSGKKRKGKFTNEIVWVIAGEPGSGAARR